MPASTFQVDIKNRKWIGKLLISVRLIATKLLTSPSVHYCPGTVPAIVHVKQNKAKQALRNATLIYIYVYVYIYVFIFTSLYIP